ncbi:glycoside hydrolase family 3 C-terminal domain-containing protein [Faecalibacterium sp. An122]|uniref:beta-glucosidase family protein n=1 Tax=Faecalibacterium sp. An122 TaxID=1965551 RepID=UPI000B379D36|nr:glycoside hydrolase family 3 C-terminal domain-containing protein [Faecalibacterium sp. An122]OUQ34230.1 glycosyl hydrolase [Faecalibacterium sp. An122]
MNYSELIGKLTLEEKCALLSGAETFKTRSLPQHGIPQLWLSDGPHGVRKQAGESDHLGQNPSEPATCFPTASAVANSWDPDLGQAIGAALGEEAAAQGVGVLLGPGLNIKRNPLCGRNFEYFSEDPYLSGKMAAGYVRGIQSQGIAACPKHFAVNNQESLRMVSNSIVDERTLREIYLRGFELVLEESSPRCIMTSYNQVNGEYANENPHLLKDILRGEWGYRGAVVTDWGGSNDHALGVKLGSTLEMPAPGGDSVRELMKAVRDGKISEADIHARLEELLELAVPITENLQSASKTIDWDAHHALARRAAAESMVLLKNRGNILPLDPDASIALIGDFADTPRYQGAGSSMVNAPRVDAFRPLLEQSGLHCTGYAPGFNRTGQASPALQAEAVELAKSADLVLLFLGLDEVQESEGLDRSQMKLAANQFELLMAIHRTNPHVVVVLSSGSAVEAPWVSRCQALVWTGLSGQAGAAALLDLLTGKINPSGKLAETWPLHYEDAPSCKHFGGARRNVEYREGLYVGYRYYQTVDEPVAFPFGYGLSYTSFHYSGLSADPGQVTLTVTNTGSREGDEVVQVYIAKPDAAVFRPAEELKGFARVHLAPGETKTVSIPLDQKAFSYWNTLTGRWAVEGGRYEVRVGASCADIRLTADLTVEPDGSPSPYQKILLPHYASGQIQDVPKAEFEALLGHPVPEEKIRIDRNMTLGEIGHGRSPLGWLIHAVHKRMLENSLKKGAPDLNLLFNYNMPLRAMAKMTNGMVSMGMVDGLVMELKGFWLIGLARVLWAALWNAARNRALEKRLKGGPQ